jgi:uncharacterized protein YjiS (DUF1127 family)
MSALIRITPGRRLATTFRLWRRWRRDKAELACLPEHMLNDIGLTGYVVADGCRRLGRL